MNSERETFIQQGELQEVQIYLEKLIIYCNEEIGCEQGLSACIYRQLTIGLDRILKEFKI